MVNTSAYSIMLLSNVQKSPILLLQNYASFCKIMPPILAMMSVYGCIN